MLITTVCTNCDATLKAPEAVLGKRVKCTKCGKPFVAQLPIEDEEAPRTKTVKMKAVAPPPIRQRSDRDDAAKESPPGKRKKPDRRNDDDEDPAVMAKARSSRDDDDEDEDTPKPKAKKKGKKSKKKPAGLPVMLFVLIGIGALVLIGGLIGVYFAFFQKDSQPTTSTTQTPTGGPGAPIVPDAKTGAATAGWVEINETDGKYKLKFPTQPTAQDMKQQTPVGPATLKVYLLGGQSEVFLSTHRPVPDRGDLTDDQLLDQAVQMSRAQSKGATISNTKPITYQTFPGREFVLNFTGKKGSMIVRAILASDRIIVLTAGGDNASASSPRVKAFFESLKIE